MNAKWLWILAFFVAFGLLFTAALRVLTPKEALIPETTFNTTNYDRTSTTFSRVTFTGERKSFPTSVPVYASRNTQSSSSIVSDLVQKYSLVNQNKVNETWLGTSGESLRIDKYTNQHQLYFKSDSLLSDQLQLKDLTPLVVTKLAQVLPIPDTTVVKVDEDRIGYSRADSELDEEVDFTTADTVVFPINYVINDLPVRYGKDNEDPFFVLLSKTGTLKGILFYPYFLTFELGGTKKLISLDQALSNISANNASVIGLVYADGQSITTQNIAELNNVQLTTVDLEYRVDDQSLIVYPFYRFSGTAIDGNSHQVTIDLITSAVELEQLPSR